MPERQGSDLVMGLVLAALGLAMLGWLAFDVSGDGDVAPLQGAARAASAALWLGLAVVVWSERPRANLVGFGLAAAAVVVLLTTMVGGLILVPDDFTNTTSKGPRTPEQARGLGFLLLAAVLGASVWLWRRARC